MFKTNLKNKVKAVVFLLMLASLVSCGDVVDNDEENPDLKPGIKNPADYSLLRALYEVVDLKEAYRELGMVFQPEPRGLGAPFPEQTTVTWQQVQEYEAKVKFYEEQIFEYGLFPFSGLIDDFNFPYFMFRLPIMNVLRETGHYTFVDIPEEPFMAKVNQKAIGPDGKILRFDTLPDLIQAALLADLNRGLSAETLTAMLKEPTPQGTTARGIVPAKEISVGKYAFPAWPKSSVFGSVKYEMFYFFDNSSQGQLTQAAKNDVLTQMQKWENRLGSSSFSFVDVQTSNGLNQYWQHLQNSAFGSLRVLPVKISAFTPANNDVRDEIYELSLGPRIKYLSQLNHPGIGSSQAAWNAWFQAAIDPQLKISTYISGDRRLIATLHVLGHMLGLADEFMHPAANQYISAPVIDTLGKYNVVSAGDTTFGFALHDIYPGRSPYYDIVAVWQADTGEYINATPLPDLASIMLLYDYAGMMNNNMKVIKGTPGGPSVGVYIKPKNSISNFDSQTVWLNHKNREAHNEWVW